MGLTRTELRTVQFVLTQEMRRKEQYREPDREYIRQLDTIWDKLNKLMEERK